MASIKQAFEGFDPNNAEFSSAWSWPIGVKVILFTMIIALVTAGGVFTVVEPKHKGISKIKKSEVELKEQFMFKASQVSNLDALRLHMADVEQQFSDLLKQLPTDQEVPGLLEDITAIGVKSGLEIDGIELQPEVKAQFYVELPIKIKVRGNYHQMGQFISGIASIKRIVTLNDYVIQPEKESNVITMTIHAKTYRYDDSDNASTGEVANETAR